MRLSNKHLLGPCALLFLATMANSAPVNFEWGHLYNSGQGQSYDIPRKVAYDGAGNIYTGGTIGIAEAFGDFVVIKRNPNGTVAYTKVVSSAEDQMADMVVDTAGNVYVTGTVDNGTLNKIFTFKLDTSGTVVWSKTYTGVSGHASASALALDASGNVFVTGGEEGASGRGDLTIIKYSGSNGTPLWSRRKDLGATANEDAVGIGVDSLGNAIIGGRVFQGVADSDFFAIKYSPSGDLVWDRVWDSEFHKNDIPRKMIVGAFDRICMTGTSSSGGSTDVITLVYEADGTLSWAKRFDGFFGSDGGMACVMDPNGLVFVGGFVQEDGPSFDGLLLKYSANGAFNWKKIYKGPADDEEYVDELAFDSEKQLLALIKDVGVGSQEDITVAKFNPVNGAQTWKTAFNGPAGGEDLPVHLAAGTIGDFAVCGIQNSLATNRDFITLRFSQDPIANPDSYDVTESTPKFVSLLLGVMRNDLYYGIGVGIAALVDPPQHGMVQLNNGGSFTYTPTNGFVGTDTFTYRIVRQGKISPATTVTLNVKAIVPQSLELAQTTVYGGFSTTATVNISVFAPPGGITMDVSSASSAIIVPPTVTIAANSGSANFPVNTTNVATEVTRIISVSRAGVTKNAALTIKPYPVLKSLVVMPSSIVGGSNATGTVNLNVAAPPNGVTVDITDNSTAIFTPMSVLVPEGATLAEFNIGTAHVAASAIRTVTASFNGVSKTVSVTLLPVALTGIGVQPSTVVGGTPTTATVTLNGVAPVGGTTVTITPNSNSIVTPPTVKVLEGMNSVSFEVQTKPVGAIAVRTITATCNGVSKSCSLTLTPP